MRNPQSNYAAVDVGFGRVKAIAKNCQLEYPSVVADFRPVRYMACVGENSSIDRLCCEYAGKRFFIGDIVFKQAEAKVTMNSDRFTQPEGLCLLFSSLALLPLSETINLVTGLPVSDFASRKKDYIQALLGKHTIKLFNPDGSQEKSFRFNIAECRILPQPMGTVFNRILDGSGELENKKLAAGNLGILDIGQHTVDLVRVDSLEFIDNQSDSYSDLGLFEAYNMVYREIKNAYGIEIPPAKLEPYLRQGYVEMNGNRHNLKEIKHRVFSAFAEQIVSRTLNLWRDTWQLNSVILTGGGAKVLGSYIMKNFNSPIELIDDSTMSNVEGYLKLAHRVWR